MITAETITDEQIEGLGMLVLQMPDGPDARMIARACVTALRRRDPKRETRHQYARVRAKARARCAEILNASAMPVMACGCAIDAHSDTVNVGMGPGTGSTCGRGWPIERKVR